MNHDDVYYALQDKLHDKEARIRELEGALRRARQPLHDHGWCLHHQADRTRYPRGHADGDLIWSLVSDIDGLLANSPPDSEPRGEVVVTANERGDAVTVTRQDEEGEILSVIWERDSESATPPDQTAVDDLVAEYERDPAKREAIDEARSQLADREPLSKPQRFRQDEIDRGVLLVYRTRNEGWFNFRQTTIGLKEMGILARREYACLLRSLADDVAPDSEPAEGERGDDLVAHVADSQRRVNAISTPPEQQDAMLERRDAVGLARLFHDTYERLAPQYGYKTRQETREFDPDSANGRLMVTVCDKICEALFRTSDEDYVDSLKEANPLKCDACGQFISWKDFEKGLARRALVTPDSHYSYEEYETLCAVCAPLTCPSTEGKP